jgi:hypothetical protein
MRGQATNSPVALKTRLSALEQRKSRKVRGGVGYFSVWKGYEAQDFEKPKT